MSTEQRLIEALDAAQTYEPSPDLWDRVVHSIEEDGQHRRRVWMTAAAVAITLLVAIGLAAVNVHTGPSGAASAGTRIDWRVAEALEIGLLVSLLATLGPAIRRFGRGFAGDLFQQHRQTGEHLLRLLDVAYYLVFVGYIAMTTRLAEPEAFLAFRIGDQIEEAAMRIGGMLLTMGVLHATTLVALPMVAFVFNTTQAGRKLPRWVVIILIIAAVSIVTNLPALLALFGDA